MSGWSPVALCCEHVFGKMRGILRPAELLLVSVGFCNITLVIGDLCQNIVCKYRHIGLLDFCCYYKQIYLGLYITIYMYIYIHIYIYIYTLNSSTSLLYKG